jgi:hypothetical protein
MSKQFSLNSDQKVIFETANEFGKKELYPLSEKMDNEEWWPNEIFKKMGDLGLLGLTVDPKFGGSGMTYLQAGLVCQAFSKWNHAIALSWLAHDNLCLDNIYRNGSDLVRKKYVPKLCSGELVGCLGLTEPGAGSDALGSMKTTAKRQGTNYVLNGSKTYITNGAIADIILVYAKTDTKKGNKGISAFIVETKALGFKVVSKLGQSWLTSIFFTFYAFLFCLSLIWKTKPRLLLVNGPGTCVPIVCATRLLSLLRIFKTQIVFVESICRVKTLSLSARLLMTLRILDVTIVQWPELENKYPQTKYIGKFL